MEFGLKFDIKTLLVLGGLAVTFGGFYYTTQMRLDALENKVQILTDDIRSTRSTLEGVSKHMKRVSKRVTKQENKN